MNTTALGVCPRNRGFTLIELMVVLTVLGVMVAFAAPNFREYRRNSALTNTVNTLVSSVYRARTEAMNEGVPAIMAPGNASGPSGDNWAQGWVIYIDRDLSDTYTAGDDIVSVQAGDEIPSEYIAIENTSTKGNYVKFNGAGFPRDNSNGFGALTFNITRTDKDGDRYIRRIILSGSGRVKSCRPDVDGATNCPAGSSSSSGGGNT